MKYQEIILVTLGYVIGFATAFIWLSASDGTDRTETAVPTGDNYGLVANASQRAAIVDAFVDNDGLFARIGDRERIISAGTIAPDGNTAGFHYAVPYLAISPNQQYLHYCALTEPEDTTCDHYIYEVSTDSIYPVKDTHTDVYLESDTAGLEAMWTENNLLSVNGLVSRSGSEPWMLE